MGAEIQRLKYNFFKKEVEKNYAKKWLKCYQT